MHERLEKLACLSVGRACAFAALGIFTFFIGLSANIALAMKAAGVLTLLTSLVLILKAAGAGRRPYKRTELWIMLRPEERPLESVAQQIVGSVLRETYLRFAAHAAVIAALMLGGSIVYGMLA
jgi:sulfite exporter TauE/SafE